jgi:hypothetical protein
MDGCMVFGRDGWAVVWTAVRWVLVFERDGGLLCGND